MPLALTELRGLQALALVDPDLPGLPRELSRLTRLRSLRLALFHLGSLPHGFGGLVRLRELAIESHHLCGLPDELRALQALRSLTLQLPHVYVHDWERPAHVPPRFTQSLADLFALLAALPRLTSLTLGEDHSYAMPGAVFDRLPPEFGGLQALESLTLEHVSRVGAPHGVVMPALRQIRTCYAGFDATEAELRAIFPNADLSGGR
ncbi:MAG: hypothetical protein JNL82_37810 [Myxococcales bacterium]|nr:hypothetical protein [Myxococcales bacterium]